MSQGMYIQADGFFYKLHPALKILAVLFLFVPPFVFTNPLYTAAIFVFLFSLIVISGSIKNLWKLKAIVLLLFVISLVVWPIFKSGGEVYYSLGPVRITQFGMLYGLSIAFRLNCFILTALLLLSTTKVEEFSRGLVKLGIPFRVSFALSLSFRLIPLFMESGRTIVAAQKSRGLDLEKGNVFSRAPRYIPVMVPILLTAIRKADSMAIALDARGFGANKNRTSLSDRKAGWRDALALGIAVCLMAASVLLRSMKFGILS